jgi:hypothetical protein
MNTAATATTTASPWVPVIAATVGAAAALIVGVVTQLWSGRRERQQWEHERQYRKQQWKHERQDRQQQWDSERASRVWEKQATAYEAALTETVNRWARHSRWMRSDSETWTTENLAEYLKSQEDPGWSAAEGRLLAYSSQEILTALYEARSADECVSQEMDKAKKGLEAGKSTIAAGNRTQEQALVKSLVKPVRAALNTSLGCDYKLIRLMQTVLHPDDPAAVLPRPDWSGEAPPG